MMENIPAHYGSRQTLLGLECAFIGTGISTYVTRAHPTVHQKSFGLTPSRQIEDANQVGPTEQLAESILAAVRIRNPS